MYVASKSLSNISSRLALLWLVLLLGACGGSFDEIESGVIEASFPYQGTYNGQISNDYDGMTHPRQITVTIESIIDGLVLAYSPDSCPRPDIFHLVSIEKDGSFSWDFTNTCTQPGDREHEVRFQGSGTIEGPSLKTSGSETHYLSKTTVINTWIQATRRQ
jgi:hypothetical protein